MLRFSRRARRAVRFYPSACLKSWPGFYNAISTVTRDQARIALNGAVLGQLERVPNATEHCAVRIHRLRTSRIRRWSAVGLPILYVHARLCVGLRVDGVLSYCW
jgi:hypothetical protein